MAAIAFRSQRPTSMESTICDENADTAQLVYGGGKLYQRHYDGSIHLFNGPDSYWRWTTIQGAGDNLIGIAATHKHLYKMKTSGELSRYNESTKEFDVVKNLIHIKDFIASDNSFFYLKGIHGGNTEGIQMEDIDDPSPSYEDLEAAYQQSQKHATSLDAEVNRLKASKAADAKIIDQLHKDYKESQIQNAQLTTDLKSAREQIAKVQSDYQAQITKLQKSLTAAQAAEKKLAEELDEEKKKEHEEWKKEQEHEAKEHKALDEAHKSLEESQAHGAELQKQVDSLSAEVSSAKALIKDLESQVNEAQANEDLAEAELEKYHNDDGAMSQRITGLEIVIGGLRREVAGQEELIRAYKRRLQMVIVQRGDDTNSEGKIGQVEVHNKRGRWPRTQDLPPAERWPDVQWPY